MSALFVRLGRYLGVKGIVRLLIWVGVLIVMHFVGGPIVLRGVAQGMLVTQATFVLAGAIGYRRSSSAADPGDLLVRLEQLELRYCLVLRPFGADGEIVMPRGERNGRAGLGLWWNATMEQVVAGAARKALGMETYGLVNRRSRLAPPGMKFVRASDGEWRSVAERLIRRAHAIVLILPPGRDIAEGFAWEVQQIVNFGQQRRVLILLPPPDRYPQAHRDAIRRAGVLVALMEGSGHQEDLDIARADEAAQDLSHDTLVVSTSDSSALLRDDPGRSAILHLRRRMVVADLSYHSCLVPMLRKIGDRSSPDLPGGYGSQAAEFAPLTVRTPRRGTKALALAVAVGLAFFTWSVRMRPSPEEDRPDTRSLSCVLATHAARPECAAPQGPQTRLLPTPPVGQVSKAELVAKADAICRAAAQSPALRGIDGSRGVTADMFALVLASSRDVLGQLRVLPAPTEDRELLDAYFRLS